MKGILLLFFPLLLVCQNIQDSMLYQAAQIAKKYSLDTSKAPIEKKQDIQAILKQNATWLMIDLNHVQKPPFQTLCDHWMWEQIKDMGVDTVFIQNLKGNPNERSSISLNPKDLKDFEDFQKLIEKKGISLVVETIGSHSLKGVDFDLATLNVSDYASLYQMIEINPKNWNLLPTSGPIDRYTLKQLSKIGYPIQEELRFSKKTNWMVSKSIQGVDRIFRKWIFKTNQDCCLEYNWLSSTLSTMRLAFADILDSTYTLKSSMIYFAKDIPSESVDQLCKWSQKLSQISIQDLTDDIEMIINCKADLIVDHLTLDPFFYGLTTQDATVLKKLYQKLMEEKINMQKFVHHLTNLDQLQWQQNLISSEKNNKSLDQIFIEDALKKRWLKTGKRWENFNTKSLSSFEKERLNYLLFFFYCMQPGSIAFSEKIPTNDVKKLLKIRKKYKTPLLKPICIIETKNPSLFLMLYQCEEQNLQISAINFSNKTIKEDIILENIRFTTAIDMLTELNLKKAFESSKLSLEFSPLETKAIFFKNKKI